MTTQLSGTARPYADLKGTAVMEQLMLSIGARVEAASRGEAFDVTGQRDMAIEICSRLDALEAIAVPYTEAVAKSEAAAELEKLRHDFNDALDLIKSALHYARNKAEAEFCCDEPNADSVAIQTPLHDFIMNHGGFYDDKPEPEDDSIGTTAAD